MNHNNNNDDAATRRLKGRDLRALGVLFQRDLPPDLRDASECLMEALRMDGLTVEKLDRVRSLHTVRVVCPNDCHAVLKYKVLEHSVRGHYTRPTCSLCHTRVEEGRPVFQCRGDCGWNASERRRCTRCGKENCSVPDKEWIACLRCVDAHRKQHVVVEDAITPPPPVPMRRLASVRGQVGSCTYDNYYGEYHGFTHLEFPLHRAVANRDCSFEVIRYIGDAFPEACRIPTSDRQTPLHIACRVGCRDSRVVQYLYDNGPRMLVYPSKQRQWLPLHFAIHHAATKCDHSQEDQANALALVELLIRLNPQTAGPINVQGNAGRAFQTHTPDVLEFTERKFRQCSTSSTDGQDERFGRTVLGLVRRRYQEQESRSMAPQRALRVREIRDRLRLWYSRPEVAKLKSEAHRFLEVAARVGDKTDCLYHHMRTRQEQLAILCASFAPE